MEEDFEGLIRLWGDKVYNFAYRLCGNEADARDLVQEAFMRAFEHRQSYDPARPFDSWLARILRNVYVDALRRDSRHPKVSLDALEPASETPWSEILPGPDAQPDAAMLGAERDGFIQKALGALPGAARAALILCDIDGLSYEEIAGVMDVPVGTVRSRIHQARARLRDAFARIEEAGGHA